MRDRERKLHLTSPRRTLVVSPVFDSYWRFAYERQQIFKKRVSGLLPPWTSDPILATYRFTNAFRAADRVSQFLVRNVIYRGEQTAEEIFFRTILFKLFNRIDTWMHLQRQIGEISWAGFDYDNYRRALTELLASGCPAYSSAYIIPSPRLGESRKHENHLRLLQNMMKQRLPSKVVECQSLEAVFRLLASCPSLGPFLSFQFAIDLNYSSILAFYEEDYVVAGPGARAGLRKCFIDTGNLSDEDLIKVTAEIAGVEFERLGLEPADLWGRPLQLIDYQNLYCEVGKYARVAHPDANGGDGRTRIKRRFSPAERALPQWYPPKWNLEPPIASELPQTGMFT